MSTEQDKFKHSKRLLKDENTIKKQLAIIKQRDSFPSSHSIVEQPHRLVKHNAMDCGNPQCGLCGNPRHIRKGEDRTVQEKRAMQDIENVKHTNGDVDKE